MDYADQAARDFPTARHLAYLAGILLVRHSPYHYQLAGCGGEGWLVNLYPTTGTVYVDPRRACRALKMRQGWRLEDSVRAALSDE